MNSPADVPRSSAVPAGGELPAILGFELPDDDWLRLVGAYQNGDSLGSLGAYRLEAELGRGGQGIVYRAVEPRTGRVVAIKRVRTDLGGSNDHQTRFANEVRAAAALKHPNIVTVYGAEQVDGALLMAMEYIEGVPINRWAAGDPDASGTDTQRRPPQSARQILELFAKICHGVGHAHQRGVIHRDLKPSNVLVDAQGEPHVLDFGLARVSTGEATHVTRTAGFVGTPAFAAPEQFGEDDGAIDVRSDVYAVGCMLFQALTGRLPHGDGAALADIVEAIRHRDPVLPSSLRRDLNREIDAIAMKALAKRKDERYQSMDALADDIRRYLEDQPVLAHPPTPLYQFRKLMRRKRGVVLGSAAFLVLLVTSSIVSTVLFARSVEARNLAEKNETAALREARQQRDTADALLGIIRRITQHAAGRPTVSIRRLADWIASPLDPKSPLDVRPDVQFDLSLAVGSLLMTSHAYKEAAEHLQRAREFAVAAHEIDTAKACSVLLDLAAAHRALKEYDQAEAAADEVLQIALRTSGRTSPIAARALSEVAPLQLARGAVADAERTLREIIWIRDESDPRVDYRAQARMDFASFLHSAGRPDEARALLLEAQEILECAPDHNPNLVAQIWLSLAWNAEQAGRLAEAEQYLARTVEYRLKRQGLEYFRTNQALRGHGNILHKLSQYAKAADRYEKALIWQMRARSEDAVDLAALRFRLAAALLADGRAEEARPHLLRAVSRGKTSTPGDRKWDAAANRAEAALRENGWNVDAVLRDRLGKLSWLIPIAPEETVAGGVSPASDPVDRDDNDDLP